MFGGFLTQTGSSEVVKIGPFIDPADDVTEKTALTVVVELSKNGGSFAARSSGVSITHDSDAWYDVDLNATDRNTAGILTIKSHDAANHKPVYREYYILANSLHTYFVSDSIKADITRLENDAIASRRLLYLSRLVQGFQVDDSTFTPTSTQFEIKLDVQFNDTPSSVANLYRDLELYFSGTANKGQRFRITAYDGTTSRITITPAASATISNNDEVAMIGLSPLGQTSTRTEIDNSLIGINLDHLMSVAATGVDIADDSAIAQIVSKSPTADFDTFNNETDSLEALADSTTPSIKWAPLIPRASIGLGDTVELGIEVSDADGNLPTVSEINPGTIRIQRRAVNDVGFTEIVGTTAVPDVVDGMMTFSEAFSTAAGYFEGDTIRVTLAGQKVTISSVDHDLTSVGGNVYYFDIRHSIPQRFKDLYENAFFIRGSVDVVTNDGDFTIQAETNYSLSTSNDTYNGVWLVFTENNNDGVAKFVSTYTGATKRVQFLSTDGNRDSPFPNTVVTGDKFFLIGHR